MSHRDYLAPVNRFTLKLGTPQEVEKAHQEFSKAANSYGITETWDLERKNGQVSFIFSDLDKNWWELTASN
jgi:hypothetical protein